MFLSSFLVAFLFSFCWAANEGNSNDEIPFVISSQGNTNEEIPFLTSSQGNNNEEIPFVTSSQGNTNEEIPFLTSSQGNSDEQKVSNLLPGNVEPDVPPSVSVQSPDSRGRSDIEIEDDQPKGGYFYPKPSKSFNLPQFMTLEANAPLNFAAGFAEENTEVERLPRSPRRRPYFGYHQTPPPFIPGFIPPNNIRPLPALYGRPGGF